MDGRGYKPGYFYLSEDGNAIQDARCHSTSVPDQKGTGGRQRECDWGRSDQTDWRMLSVGSTRPSPGDESQSSEEADWRSDATGFTGGFR